jgi:hypothetical protein
MRPSRLFIARELVETVRKSATIDRAVRESVRANIRRYIKRVLRTYGCKSACKTDQVGGVIGVQN